MSFEDFCDVPPADYLSAVFDDPCGATETAPPTRRSEPVTAASPGRQRAPRAFGELVGASAALQRIAAQIEQVAATDANVLVLGESGTGKELVARELHRRSDRAGQPMVRVNCASIPAALYESEFFGHVRGAFTGAVQDRAGRFEMADGGTIFLDEIGELPLEMQAKMLRVLQEGSYERVGDARTRRVDVRVIAATNCDLAADVAAKRFRGDLFYRLNVFPIEVPPLRQRRADIALLAEHFVGLVARRMRRPVPVLTAGDAARLAACDWPGHVRELQTVIARGVIAGAGARRCLQLPAPAPAAAPTGDAVAVMSERQVRQLERDNMRRALRLAQGKIGGPGGAAELLGMNPSTLASRIRRLKLGRCQVGG